MLRISRLYRLPLAIDTRTNLLPALFSRSCQHKASPDWKINMLYDSECPLCMHEVNFLMKRDRKQLIKFTDIAQLDYKPELNGGISYEVGMKKIYAVKSDGEIISGMEVFRQVYKAVGLGWVWSFTQLPGFSKLFDRFYDVWASWRMKITGRPELEIVFEERRQILQKMSQNADKLCEEKDSCKV
eukprot:TRINITY_DN6486_c0_g1_i5.p1 TRINITY_DN6486_c0_g1~~TRINITY_DN6486_c0_g1_i5.p1  ORF type:complete len:196 (+),score=12.01 TRINITY_DN6486_c0_g1_i5:35-589(+)